MGLFFFAENFDTFQTILKSCMLYSFEGIRKSTILTIGNLIEPPFFNARISKINQKNKNCGAVCKDCASFKKDLCVGCPNSQDYKGNLKI
ncbi:MAG: hypothetical protein ACTSO9_17355 [Candidatus Helarchaeota archaeon]